MKILVKPINDGIYYEGIRYEKGMEFAIEQSDFMAKYMTFIGDLDVNQTDADKLQAEKVDTFIEAMHENKLLSESQLMEMDMDQLKAYGELHDVKFGRASTHEGMVKRIVEYTK